MVPRSASGRGAAAATSGTKAGAGLREALAKGFEDWDAELAQHQESCTPPFDPAAWHPSATLTLCRHSKRDAEGYDVVRRARG